MSAPACVTATGAFLKNRACNINNDQLVWSPLHGNLDQTDACLALEASVQRLCNGSKTAVAAVVHDLHPDFFSSRLASTVANTMTVPAIAVQHHHAHIAATVAEHGIRSAVIGVALDGTGYGSDGTSWGGELLWVDGGWSAHRWQRLAHLSPIVMPGGDKAAREPWRLAVALLHDLGRSTDSAPCLSAMALSSTSRDIVVNMLQRRLNCPETSSAGRWFDAAAAALGLTSHQSHEAEAAQRLEQRASEFLTLHPEFDWPWQSLDLRPIVAALFEVDTQDRQRVSRGAAIFHLALANGLAHAAVLAANRLDCRDIALGGGCFVNAVLRERLITALQKANLRVYTPMSSPCGDAGLALGQAWVAACAQRASSSRARSVIVNPERRATTDSRRIVSASTVGDC